ncbi:TRPM8 channel-associated factor homolog [Hyla sarda]|uniref:TRPM8 channel-associated factor homolog n=1 Tax=Hyla sarda TaxID=327740 RepID=UPI0024C36BFC|nr:TRPM8 channel-associated factor homolog [Hyla sarda]XP_056428955.1 TRPM8 channel-associated factor homolog [Hyla sarda]XP_056428956.1 TRPM8 channel-associated factor homolog [Hyla sarda]XP_056428957.1 TRPM8 channel-associated factor homolog [Hyla sarda]XP_056428958.1 TRPM8 channel-associated factor homolog [Hyla sarda]XP_056428960.1 TRPM8 channel-associated factor homolog [Hyla sarda]XP_056428961.1 TRPM8 channel-associated factor homolog [Hyla sarda]
MAVNEDYHALVQGIGSVNFSGNSIPCKLLLTGDSAFPVLASPGKHVLIAASKYGKGRVVVLGHEAFLNLPQIMDFLKKAISWLKPSPEAIIGVENNLGHLEQTLIASGHKVEKVSGVKKDLGVLCMSGYNDSQAKEVVSFVKEGGGLLIGAQAWHWAQSNKQDNVLCHFPGNKITSVSGIYFTGQVGEIGNFNVSEKIPWCPFDKDVNFSADLKHLMQGVSNVDISGGSVPSELLLHGPLTFPIGLTKSNQCFFAAAYYGRGRVVVGTHEGYLCKPQLKPFWLNAVSWLDMGRQGKIGVVSQLKSFANILQTEGFQCAVSNLVPDLSVYCCTSYSDAEAEKIQQFVAEGGGLLIVGHAWYWSYSHPNVLSQYPGNKVLNKLGISILGATVPQGIYPVLDPQAEATTYHFPRAICQLLCDLKSGVELKPPLSNWLSKLRQDVSTFMRLPASPLILSLQEELVHLVHNCSVPSVSKQHPAKSCSKEAFMMCLAQEVTCLDKLECDCGPCKPPVTVQIDATNPGPDAWRSLGLYLPPRKTATLVFPASAVGKGLQVQIGCHSDNLSGANEYCRAPVVVHRKGVVNEKVSISCAWGGLLYVIVKGKSQLGNVRISVQGVELAPMFIKGKISRSSWVDKNRHHPAPWAELITENIILTVPSDVIRSLDDPDALMSQWDKIMEAIADLASTPKKFLRPERFVTDVQISAGWMHAGYPIMCHLPSATALVSLENIKKGLWGPVHELGHNQQRGAWEFPPHTTEATCNLWSVYVHETVLGIPRDKAHPNLKPEARENRVKQYVKNGANLAQWSVWIALETYLQLQEGFGWDPFKQVFAEYQTLTNVSKNKNVKMNLWAEKFSHAVNKNLVPFFKAWGWPIDDATNNKLSTLPEWDKDPMKSYVSSK